VLIRVASSFLPDAADKPTNPCYLDAPRAIQPLFDRAFRPADVMLARTGPTLLVVFDALDRWPRLEQHRELTRALLSLTVGLQSFKSIRAKILMRVDQFSDHDLFRFPDGFKDRIRSCQSDLAADGTLWTACCSN